MNVNSYFFPPLQGIATPEDKQDILAAISITKAKGKRKQVRSMLMVLFFSLVFPIKNLSPERR